MINGNVTVLTVVPYEEPRPKQDDLTELLEDAANLVSAVTDLTKNVKEMIEQKTRHGEPRPSEQASMCTCTTSTTNSFNEFKQKRKPPYLVDISRDVSVCAKIKNDSNICAKGLVPTRSSGAINSLRKAFEKKHWVLKGRQQGLDGLKKMTEINKKAKMEQECKEEKASVPFESTYVEHRKDKDRMKIRTSRKASEPENYTYREDAFKVKELAVKSNAGSSFDLLSSLVHSQAAKNDCGGEETVRLANQVPEKERSATSKYDWCSRGESKERKDRKRVPILSKIKVIVRQSSAPLLN